jgi:polyisoprenoid-binding protein YceI
MPRRIAIGFAFAVVLAGVLPMRAQPTEPATFEKVEGGQFKLDKSHARIVFSTSHLGFSTYYGFFGEMSGTLEYDPKAPAKSAVEVAINLDRLVTNDPELDENLKSADYFDVAKFPVATFKSTESKVLDAAKGKVTGDLTLHGVTKPVTLDVALHGAGANPATGDYVLGFDATGTISRSDFGIKTLVPFVGDEVKLMISCEFDRIK